MAVPFLPPMSHMITEWSELPENSTRWTGSQQSAVTPPEGPDRLQLVTEGRRRSPGKRECGRARVWRGSWHTGTFLWEEQTISPQREKDWL